MWLLPPSLLCSWLGNMAGMDEIQNPSCGRGDPDEVHWRSRSLQSVLGWEVGAGGGREEQRAAMQEG